MAKSLVTGPLCHHEPELISRCGCCLMGGQQDPQASRVHKRNAGEVDDHRTFRDIAAEVTFEFGGRGEIDLTDSLQHTTRVVMSHFNREMSHRSHLRLVVP